MTVCSAADDDVCSTYSDGSVHMHAPCGFNQLMHVQVAAENSSETNVSGPILHSAMLYHAMLCRTILYYCCTMLSVCTVAFYLSVAFLHLPPPICVLTDQEVGRM